MSRKKEEHEKEPNHERWLVSYADFITLLFATFVVLYAMSQVDEARVAKVIASTNESFGLARSSSAPVFNVIDSSSTNLVPMPDPIHKTPVKPETSSKETRPELKPITKKTDSTDEAFNTPASPTSKSEDKKVEPPVQKSKADSEEFKKIKAEITDVLKAKEAEDKIKLEIDQRGLVISLKDSEFFDSGKAVVRARSMYLLDNIAAAINKYSNFIRIEGHTDNIPIKTSTFPSNWELSTARATNIVHYLTATHALPPEKLSAIGYAEYRPIADNSTEEGRQKNRRVDVVLLSSAGEQGEPGSKPEPGPLPGPVIQQESPH